MSEKRFTCVLGKDYHIINNNIDNMTYYLQDGNDVVLVINLLNRLVEENEQLRTQLLICQQSKNDDGRFKVWQVPPIRRGMRVSITTIDDEQKRDSKRLEMVRMSEKRFQKGMNLSCVDTETGKNYWYACNLCGLLNEQQTIIEALKRENDKLYHWKSNDTLKEPVTYEAKEEVMIKLDKGAPL
ncbi:hypothetical protein [Methanobrevibacter sp.]|uniref:hypothetical protein n=1 Tax=Methanobrevibacter sp. TaxID=66852 RepID=UPI00388D922C